MKKYLLAAVALPILLGSCSDNDGNEIFVPEVNEQITMASGISPSTRAPIESVDDNGTNHGIPKEDQTVYFLRATDAATIDWTETGLDADQADGHSKGILGATLYGMSGDNPANAGKIQFGSRVTPTTEVKQYYNANENLKSAFIGFYPYGTPSQATLSPVKITWDIDGKTDILVSDSVAATKNIKKLVAVADRNLTPEFHHLLTWLDFNVIAADEGAIGTWGSVESIKIANTASSVSYDLSQFTTPGTPNTHAFSGSTTMGTWTKTDGTPGEAVLELTSEFYSQALVQPNLEEYKLLVSTKNSKGEKKETEVTIKFGTPAGTEKSKAGHKHEVTLTFNSNEITAIATIKPWGEGGKGTGTIN